MLTIHLHHLLFHSLHGMFKEENVLGNNFEVNADISFEPDGTIKHLSQSVDYVTIYTVIKQIMDKPTALLETVVQNLADGIYASDNKVKAVTVSIKKLNPPISNFEGTVGVSYSKVF